MCETSARDSLGHNAAAPWLMAVRHRLGRDTGEAVAQAVPCARPFGAALAVTACRRLPERPWGLNGYGICAKFGRSDPNRRGARVRSERDIAAKRIVVTGATGGIGKEIARALISRGALLTLIARDADRAAATAAELAAEPGAAEAPEIVLCDLADLSSVRAAAYELHERYDGIDVLVANAGVRSFESHTTTDGFEQMMATNHLGPFLLTNLLLDLLRAGAPSRIVITAS